MSRKRRSSLSIFFRRLATRLKPLTAHSAVAFMIVVVLAVAIGGAYVVWQKIGPTALTSKEFRLDPQNINITATPKWITAEDLKAEVIRDASLEEQLSIRDDGLIERIALAFAAHPWVAEVNRVEKFHPARVEVSIRYRQPVAAVESGGKFLPIDAGSVRLPEENFSPADLRKLPLISSIQSLPVTAPGAVWGDPRVHGAALIAEACGEVWHDLSLAEIIPSVRPTVGGDNVYWYELRTRGGTRIRWGRQAEFDLPDEPTAEEKLARLKKYVAEHGSLDDLTLGTPIPEEIPRTATKPEQEKPAKQ